MPVQLLKRSLKLYSWICRIVVNTTMDLLRSRKKEDLPGELPEQASEDVYQETDLKNALESLEPQNRTIVVLRYCEDMKLEDIALAVNENLSTVKTRLYRSLKSCVSTWKHLTPTNSERSSYYERKQSHY